MESLIILKEFENKKKEKRREEYHLIHRSIIRIEIR